MSIKPLTYYTVICDRCGDDASGPSDYSAWAQAWAAVEEAENSDWIVVPDGDAEKHYCERCVIWDDELDRLVPMPPKAEQVTS